MPNTKGNKPQKNTSSKGNKPKDLDPKELEAELENMGDDELLAFAEKECPELVKEAGEAWEDLTTEQKAAAILARIQKDSQLGASSDDEDEDDDIGDGYRLGDKSSSGVDIIGPHGERVRTYNSADHGVGFMKLAKEFVDKRNKELKAE